MCDGGKWACCTAGERDISCRSPPKPMQDIIALFADPSENMPVIFLFWWCMNVSALSIVPFNSPLSQDLHENYLILEIHFTLLKYCDMI